MSSQHSVGEMNQLADGLDEAGYTPEMITKLRHHDLLMQIKLVLLGTATIVKACFKLALDKVFSPGEFIGNGWTFWKGLADGTGLEGEEDCVAEPDVIDFEQIALDTHLKEGETSILGEEKMRRARADKTKRQLGGKAFLALRNNWKKCSAEGKPEESVLEKLRRAGKIGNVIYFFGLTLRHPAGDRCVLCLYFHGSEWYWRCGWLDYDWGASSPSVSLASV